jgi:hypothetical protein
MLLEFTLAREAGRLDRAPQVYIDPARVEYVIEDPRAVGVCTVFIAGREGVVVLGSAADAARRVNEALGTAVTRPDSWLATD